MFKLSNKIIFLGLLFTSCAFANITFDSSQPTALTTTSLSPTEFKNTVRQLSQQTSSSLSQQAKQLFPKSPASTPVTGSGSANPATPASTDNNSFSSINTNSPTATTGAAGSKSTSTQPGGDTYTGFGGSKSQSPSRPAAPASSGKSGGWNINY